MVRGEVEGSRYFALHGWSGDARSFDPIRPWRGPQQSLLAPDLPGFGNSPAPSSWTFDALSASLFRELDGQGWGRCTLVGNCAGAVVGLEMALRQPERFERLILIDPFAYVPWYFRLLTAYGLGALFYHVTFANPVGRWLTDLALSAKRKEETSLVDGFDTIVHERAFHFLRLLCSGGDAAKYRELTMPVTLLYGDRTFGAVKRSVQIFQDLWPQAEAFPLAGAGHLPIQEATPALADHVFLRDGRGHR